MKLKPKHPNVTFWPQSVNSILEDVLTMRGKIYQKWLNLYSTDVGHQFLLMKRACLKVSSILKKLNSSSSLFNDKSLLKSKPAPFKKIKMPANDHDLLKSKHLGTFIKNG